jgi:hypothetical protein
MKQYVKCRDYEKGETFPFVRLDGSEGMHPCNEALYDHWLPEAIEDDEFNMLILLDEEMVKVRSSHFDFVEEY